MAGRAIVVSNATTLLVSADDGRPSWPVPGQPRWTDTRTPMHVCCCCSVDAFAANRPRRPRRDAQVLATPSSQKRMSHCIDLANILGIDPTSTTANWQRAGRRIESQSAQRARAQRRAATRRLVPLALTEIYASVRVLSAWHGVERGRQAEDPIQRGRAGSAAACLPSLRFKSSSQRQLELSNSSASCASPSPWRGITRCWAAWSPRAIQHADLPECGVLAAWRSTCATRCPWPAPRRRNRELRRAQRREAMQQGGRRSPPPPQAVRVVHSAAGAGTAPCTRPLAAALLLTSSSSTAQCAAEGLDGRRSTMIQTISRMPWRSACCEAAWRREHSLSARAERGAPSERRRCSSSAAATATSSTRWWLEHAGWGHLTLDHQTKMLGAVLADSLTSLNMMCLAIWLHFVVPSNHTTSN